MKNLGPRFSFLHIDLHEDALSMLGRVPEGECYITRNITIESIEEKVQVGTKPLEPEDFFLVGV